MVWGFLWVVFESGLDLFGNFAEFGRDMGSFRLGEGTGNR